MILTPVTSTGQPLGAVNPVTGLPMPTNGASASLTFAVVGPLSGPFAQIGQQMVNGARAAINDANIQPSGALDRSFALVTFDDQNQPIQSALSAGYATNLSNVVGVIGHFSGTNTDAALPTYVAAQMPLVVPATSTDVVTAHGYRNVFRLPTRDSDEGRLTARYLCKHQKPQSCVVLTKAGAYGETVAQGFAQEMRAARVPVEAVVRGIDEPAAACVTRALASKPDLLFCAGKIEDLGAVFDLVVAGDLELRLIASQGFFSAVTTTEHAHSAEGLIVSTSIAPVSLVGVDDRIFADFVATYGLFTPAAGLAYAATQILIAAARRTGAIDRPSLSRALADGTTYQTIMGDYRFTPFGDQLDPNLFFYTVRKGEWVYRDSYRPAPFAINKGVA